MKKGYWIVSVDVRDQRAFGEYAARTPEALQTYGGRFLCRAGQTSVPEGAFRARNSIIEFPSYQAALDCWNSAAYQAARAFRMDAVDMDVAIVEGC